MHEEQQGFILHLRTGPDGLRQGQTAPAPKRGRVSMETPVGGFRGNRCTEEGKKKEGSVYPALLRRRRQGSRRSEKVDFSRPRELRVFDRYEIRQV